MPKGVYHRRMKRHAVIQPPDQSYRLIPLTRNQNAIVDTEDFQFLSNWNWYAKWYKNISGFYAARSEFIKKGEQQTKFLHHQILGDFMFDHINHNTLDNRKSNLRKCTHAENSRNTKRFKTNKSGFKGVHFDTKSKRWRSSIGFNYKRNNLGLFYSKEEAARAYDTAAKIYYGEFAELNFP